MRLLMIVWNFRKRNFGGDPSPRSNGLLIEARGAVAAGVVFPRESASFS